MMKHRPLILMAIVQLFTLALLPLSAAANGTITACTTTIPSTSNGVWTVSANITYTGTANCITVNASNITINLAGFVVKSTNASPGEGIVLASTASNLTVENGALEGFNIGIDTSANVTNPLTQIRGVTVRNSTGDGVSLGSPVDLITNSAFLNNGTSSVGYGVDGPSSNGVLLVNDIVCGNASGQFNFGVRTAPDVEIYLTPSSTSC